MCGPATLMPICAPASQAGLSTYECMDHQTRPFARQRVTSRDLLYQRTHQQETIYAQQEEREYPDYEGKIKAALCGWSVVVV